MKGTDMLDAFTKIDEKLIEDSEKYHDDERMISMALKGSSHKLAGGIAIGAALCIILGVIVVMRPVNYNDTNPKDQAEENVPAAVNSEVNKEKLRREIEESKVTISSEAEKLVLDPEYKEKVYSIINETLKSMPLSAKSAKSYVDLNDYSEQYTKIAELGDKAVPYIFSYIAESESNGFYEAFLDTVMAKMAYEAFPDMESQKGAEPDTPKASAYALWMKVKDHYVSDDGTMLETKE